MEKAVLINDHQLLNDLLRLYLQAHGFKTIQAFSESSEALAYITSNGPPDLILIDMMLPILKTLKGEKVDMYHPYILMDNKTAYQAVRELRTRSPSSKVIILSGERHPHTFLLGFEAGAHGIASKLDSLDEFLRILKRVMRGDSGVTSVRVKKLLDDYRQHPVPSLSEIEIKILELIQEGKESPQIARELGYSAKTIRNAICKINEKLGTTNRMEALEMAIEMGLVGWRTGYDGF
jgi:DNA-binding NarL/FixJ family response regulator